MLQLIPQPWRGKARCWTPLAPLRRRLPRRGRHRQGGPDRPRRGAQQPQQPQRVVIVGWFNANNDQWILWLAEGTNLESRTFVCFWRFAFKWVLLWEASLLAAVGHVTFVDIDTGLRNPVRQCNCPQKLEGAFERNLSKKRLRGLGLKLINPTAGNIWLLICCLGLPLFWRKNAQDGCYQR